MIQEVYVSYEVAELLRDKGFDERVRAVYYVRDKSIHYSTNPSNYNNGLYVSMIAAPTQQMTMAWLREKGVYMCIDTLISSSGNIYFDIDTYSEDSGWNHPVDFYDSYEQAVEAALKYSLENLI